LLLPLLLLGGWWLYKSDLFPQKREIVWRLDKEPGSIQFLEIQILNLQGELLKREEFYFQTPGPEEVQQRVPLSSGDYPIRVFIQRLGAEPYGTYKGMLQVRGRETIVVWVRDLERVPSATSH
jgi:hypothetical protein